MEMDWMDRLKEGGATGSPEDFEDSPKSPLGQQHGHYRRKKTNKAPRKRTFIANMTKYNDGVTGSLESAARGVGSAASGGMGSGSAAYGGPQNFYGPPAGDAEGAGAMDMFGSFPSFPTDLMTDMGSMPIDVNGLPWELAALPNLAAPVMYGSKGMPPAAAATAQPQQQAGMGEFSFTQLLGDMNEGDVDAQLADLFSNAPAGAGMAAMAHARGNTSLHLQQQQQAREAAEAAAAVAAAAAVVGPPLAPLPNPTGPPKVSFDLFPELAALASGTPLVTAPTACFSRAVVTVVEDRAAGFAPQAHHGSLPALQPSGSSAALAALEPAASMSISAGAANNMAAHNPTKAQQVAAAVVAAGSNANQGSWPGSSGHLSTGSAGSAQSVGAAHAASHAAVPAMVSSGSFGSAQAYAAALVRTGSGVSGASAHTQAMMTQAQMQQAMQVQASAAAAAGRGAGGRRGAATTATRGGAARGRGTKRTAAGSPTGSPIVQPPAPWSSAAVAANTTVAAAAAAGPSAGSGNGASSGINNGEHGVRSPPFTVPLHGVSAAGAVVPGSAGELAVSRLVSVGAYGVVYRARWVGGQAGPMGGDVAVKMMRRPQAGEGLTEVDVLRSFRHEASLLRRLAHPNIVALRHAQDVEPVCLVQDYAQHGTLSDYIHNTAAAAPSVNPMLGLGLGSSMSDLERAVLRRLARRVGLAPDALMADLEARSVAAHYSAAAVAADGSLPHANQRNMRRYIVLLCLLRDVAAAMTYLAGPLPGAQGGCVVHRDVKPSNILLSAAGSALLADFGVAKALPMPTAAGAGMLAPAASAPPSIAQLSSASSAEVAAVYAEWGSDMGGAMASKRTRSADAADVAAAVAGAVHMPDILPSTDFDMGWLDDLFADNGATAATAAAPVVVAQHPFQYAQHQAAQQQAAYAAASGPMLATRASTDSQQQQAEDSNWPQHHGTAHYAAPEDLARGRTPYALGPAADVFSLGTVIWEALSGQRPWVGVRAAVVADAVGVQGARLPLPGCWPARLRALVARCWAADPAQRPAAREVAAVLDEEVRCALRPGR